MKKALSDEEWRDRALLAERLGYAHIHDVNDTVELDGYFSGDERHAVAALCLRGKDFGFTWEDVEVVEEAAKHWAERAQEYGLNSPSQNRIMESVLRYMDLANRIAALLPPDDNVERREERRRFRAVNP